MSEKKLLATRAGYGQGLLDIGALYDDVVVLEGDLGAATGTAAFGKAYPDRYVEAGIAEQNEVGMASGLAATGWVPFVTSFAISRSLSSVQVPSLTAPYGSSMSYSAIIALLKVRQPTDGIMNIVLVR